MVLRRDPWAPESVSPTGQQCWVLLLVKAPLLAWAVAQTVRQLGWGRPEDAEAGGAVASPFGTSLLLPWVSHFVQHAT